MGLIFIAETVKKNDHNLPIKQYVRTGTKGPMKENLSIVKYWIHHDLGSIFNSGV